MRKLNKNLKMKYNGSGIVFYIYYNNAEQKFLFRREK